MSKKEQSNITALWFVISFLGAALVGSFLVNSFSAKYIFSGEDGAIQVNGATYVAVENLDSNFLVKLKKGNEFVVNEGKTWISVPGNPVELLVLTDKSCQSCSGAKEVQSLKQNITPAMIVRRVDINTAEGKKLMDQFSVQTIPQFILGAGASTYKALDGTRFVDNAKEVLTEKEGLYLINSKKVGFKPAQFIKAPVLSDLDSDPERGGGKIQVVEFTDFQCPYCAKLHQNNKVLIEKLVKEGKINYIVKDFPLAFHKESKMIHLAANQIFKKKGSEKYFEFVNEIFAKQADFSGKGEAVKEILIGMAKDLSIDITFDWNDKKTQDEIEADRQDGIGFGVSGTPALFIGKQIMPGAISAEVFEAAVEKELAR